MGGFSHFTLHVMVYIVSVVSTSCNSSHNFLSLLSLQILVTREGLSALPTILSALCLNARRQLVSLCFQQGVQLSGSRLIIEPHLLFNESPDLRHNLSRTA